MFHFTIVNKILRHSWLAGQYILFFYHSNLSFLSWRMRKMVDHCADVFCCIVCACAILKDQYLIKCFRSMTMVLLSLSTYLQPTLLSCQPRVTVT